MRFVLLMLFAAIARILIIPALIAFALVATNTMETVTEAAANFEKVADALDNVKGR